MRLYRVDWKGSTGYKGGRSYRNYIAATDLLDLKRLLETLDTSSEPDRIKLLDDDLMISTNN